MVVERAMVRISRSDSDLIDNWIVILLGVDNYTPIKDRIRFIKGMFHLSQKHVPQLSKISNFYPYHFGPYSTRVARRMNVLKNSEGVVCQTFKDGAWTYSLTEKGREKFLETSKEIDSDLLKKVATLKARLQKSTVKKILHEIYTEYPEFAQESSGVKDKIIKRVDLSNLEKIDDSGGMIHSELDEDGEYVLSPEALKNILKIISE